MTGNWDSLGKKKKSMKSCDDLTSKYVLFRRSKGALWEELRLTQKRKAAGVIFSALTKTLARGPLPSVPHCYEATDELYNPGQTASTVGRAPPFPLSEEWSSK